MWIQGNTSRVIMWYACWSAPGGSYNLEIYKTPTGLKGWCEQPAYANIPIHRLGRVVITENGPYEDISWDTREEFLNWRSRGTGF